jgi:hypothetical protein
MISDDVFGFFLLTNVKREIDSFLSLESGFDLLFRFFVFPDPIRNHFRRQTKGDHPLAVFPALVGLAQSRVQNSSVN